LNQKEMSDYLNVSENFLKEAVRNEGLPVATLGRRKFYSKKAVNEFMLKRLKKLLMTLVVKLKNALARFGRQSRAFLNKDSRNSICFYCNIS